jgi:hypothetical protein
LELARGGTALRSSQAAFLMLAFRSGGSNGEGQLRVDAVEKVFFG